MTIRRTSAPRMIFSLAHMEKTEKIITNFTTISRFVGSVTFHWEATQSSIHVPISNTLRFQSLVLMTFPLCSEQSSSSQSPRSIAPIALPSVPLSATLRELCYLKISSETLEPAQNVLPLHVKAGLLIHWLYRDTELHPRHEVQEPPTGI
jgi:hypothetical protein